MNKYEYLFGFGTEGVEKVFADSMFALIVIVLVAFALGRRIAAAKEKKQDQQARHPVAQAFGNAVKQANPSVQAAQYAFEAMRAATAATPAAAPGSLPAAPVYASAEGAASGEGTEVHEPGFHGERLKKVDLGALRAQENAHTAGNLMWTPPEETEVRREDLRAGRSAVSAQQLRQAVIMKEILDAPVSRRRRKYGR